jgi:hypothetical protein
VELLPLLQHGLDEAVQLVGALVLGPVDPPVIPLAVLQAGQDHLLELVDDGHCWWRLERISAEAWTLVGLHLCLQAEAVLADAVASLLLGVCLVILGGLLSTPTLWVSFLAILVAICSKVALDSTAARIVFSWAILPVTMSLVATVATAVWGHDDLVQALLVRGDAGHHLLAGVEDPMGPLGCLMDHCLCDCLGQHQVLLGEEVLLQLHVVDSVDEQAEDDRLAVVELRLAGQVAAGESHVALPGLGLEVGEEASAQSDQLPLGGRLTLELSSSFTSVEFTHN